MNTNPIKIRYVNYACYEIVLPNGNQINARQYIQEYVVPHIPESGTFKLKNEVEGNDY